MVNQMLRTEYLVLWTYISISPNRQFSCFCFLTLDCKVVTLLLQDASESTSQPTPPEERFIFGLITRPFS